MEVLLIDDFPEAEINKAKFVVACEHYSYGKLELVLLFHQSRQDLSNWRKHVEHRLVTQTFVASGEATFRNPEEPYSIQITRRNKLQQFKCDMIELAGELTKQIPNLQKVALEKKKATDRPT